MHTSTRTVGDKDREEKFKPCVKEKIKRIWKLFRFASDSSAQVWALIWIAMLLTDIKEKENLYRQLMNLDRILVALNICRNIS